MYVRYKKGKFGYQYSAMSEVQCIIVCDIQCIIKCGVLCTLHNTVYVCMV